MTTPLKTFSDQIRGVVDASGLSRYRICKEIGISEATMSRFMNGKGGLSMTSLDRLADLLGLEVVTRPKAAT
jgi:transcriptional regulator with XRE-family HTH domain